MTNYRRPIYTLLGLAYGAHSYSEVVSQENTDVIQQQLLRSPKLLSVLCGPYAVTAADG